MKYVLALLLLCSPAWADAPRLNPPPWVIFPTQPPAPTPEPPITPAPQPNTPATLSQDEIYAIDSKEAAFLIASPPGMVSVTQEAGPVKIRAKFVGGNGKTETRTFTGAAVFSIEAVAPGRVELIVIRVGAKGEADIQRRLVDVLVGPRPPPVPPTPADELFGPTQAAYSADASPTKAVDVKALAAVYRAVTRSLPSIKTGGDLYTITSGARATAIGDRLLTTRNVLNAELNKMGLHEQTALTEAQRAGISLLYTRFAAILESL